MSEENIKSLSSLLSFLTDCDFFEKFRILFTSGFEGLVIWWQLENPYLHWSSNELHILNEVFDFIYYKTYLG